MSARKATRGHKRSNRRRTHRRTAAPTALDIENARLELLGVYAVCELVHSSYTATRSARVVLTRGALQPLREALELLGEEDIERLWCGSSAKEARS